ncbi:MAG: TolC family protein [Candidatus Latescibacterota bacterium]|nr:MAG: TolC family protein [Candidatus Latescibacterota bacterium]
MRIAKWSIAAASAVLVLSGAAGAEKLTSVREKALADIRGGVPLTIERCVELALADNPSLRASRENARATERGVLESYATFLPTVGASYDASRTRVGFSEYQLSGNREYDSHQIGFGVNQTLFSFSGIKSIQQARNNKKSDLAGYEADEQTLIYQVRTACHDLLKMVDLLEVARENLGVGEGQLRLAEKRKEVGAGVTADVLKAKAHVESNLLDVITAEKNLAVARASLLAYLGLDVTLAVDVARPPDAEGELPSFEESMKTAAENRPDLAEIEYALRASRDGVGAAWGEYTPTVGAGFSYGWRDTVLSGDIFDESRRSWSARLSVDLPIFNVGTMSRIRQQQARAESAKYGLEGTKKGIEFEVQEAILSIEESVKRIEVATRNVAAAEEDLRISQGKYEHGLVPILDLIEAQASLRQARAARVEAVYDHLTSRAAWEKAVGRIR